MREFISEAVQIALMCMGCLLIYAIFVVASENKPSKRDMRVLAVCEQAGVLKGCLRAMTDENYPEAFRK